MSVWLVISYCLAGDCHVAEVPVDASPVMCSMSRLIWAADWVEHNEPGATIRYVRCSRGNPT